MIGPQAPVAPPRFSLSMLPIDADPAERDFVRLLERALAPSFTLVRRLGAGAMGSVYLARDPVLKRLVAVKVMAPALASDPQARARFEREAQTVASISHPNVVAVYSVGTLENGVPYLVMQYVEGKTMAERIAEGGPLDAPTAKRVLGEVASALAAAHRKGIIHRDIKPSNILWDDETGRALVTDFGIAAVKKLGDGSDPTKLTQSGVSVGTPAYMSPEQVRGEEVTEKTDIYSLGVLGYEMLIAEGPYKLENSGEVLAAHLRDEPRKLSKMRADVDPEVERLLEDCLNKDAERRPSASAAEDRITHGASILLEWPPPGLEPLRGRFWGALRPLGLGASLVGLPLVLASLFERSSPARELLPPIEFTLAIVTLGFFVFVAGALRMERFFRAAGRSVDLGYHWGTIAEAVADTRGDTGALITGGREYATQPPARRSLLRRLRVIGTGLLLASALTPVIGFAVGVVVAARFDAGRIVVLWTSLVLSLACLAAWALLDWFERFTLKAARSRRLALSSVKERPTELAAAWTDTFNQVRIGQSLGSGMQGRKKGVLRTAAAVVFFSVVAALVADILILITASVTVFAGGAIPQSNAMKDRLRRAERLAPLVVPADTSISALRAGQALHAVGRSTVPTPPRAWESPPTITVPAFQPPTDPPPFGESSTIFDAFRAARRGLSDEQRRYLRRLADNRALAEFRLAASARRADIGGAMLDVPTGSRLALYELPLPRFHGIRVAATSNIAAAALELAANQSADAERRLREVVSVGFLLIRGGNTTIENLVGAAIVSEAAQALEAFYVATGREADARAVKLAPIQPAAEVPAAALRKLSDEELAAAVRSIVSDTAAPRGMRWQAAHNLAWFPCADLRQVIFGPDAQHVADVNAAREALVHGRSDSLQFAFVELPMDEIHMTRDGQPIIRNSNSVLGWLATVVTGHRVFASCAAMVGM